MATMNASQVTVGAAAATGAIFVAQSRGTDHKHLVQPVVTANGEHEVAYAALGGGVAYHCRVDGVALLHLPHDGALAVHHQSLGALANDPLVVDGLHLVEAAGAARFCDAPQ